MSGITLAVDINEIYNVVNISGRVVCSFISEKDANEFIKEYSEEDSNRTLVIIKSPLLSYP